ncbi:MAG: hypothetical protein GYB58_19815 [Gammaproteobacteria bacterium]|nr:hypothetical protein [Gammaproteobacteria bacterium]
MTTERTDYILDSVTRGGFLINWYVRKTPKDKFDNSIAFLASFLETLLIVGGIMLVAGSFTLSLPGVLLALWIAGGVAYGAVLTVNNYPMMYRVALAIIFGVSCMLLTIMFLNS